MKPILLILPIVFLLASCSPPTIEEQTEFKKQCEANGKDFRTDTYGIDTMHCKERKDKVMDCIREFRYGLDEKYNNPDTVSHLSEDTYSNVVKTCKEVFGNKVANE